jgi:hypothetical protein
VKSSVAASSSYLWSQTFLPYTVVLDLFFCVCVFCFLYYFFYIGEQNRYISIIMQNNLNGSGGRRQALSSVDFYRRIPKDLTEVSGVTCCAALFVCASYYVQGTRYSNHTF